MPTPRVFVCHSSHDSAYVLQVCAYLKRCQMTVFTYEEHQKAGSFVKTVDDEMANADVFLIFFGETFADSPYQVDETANIKALVASDSRLALVPVVLHKRALKLSALIAIGSMIKVPAHDDNTALVPASVCAKRIVALLDKTFSVRWNAEDDLPANPHLFSYEKDIIKFFARTMELQEDLYRRSPDPAEERQRESQRQKILDGCPVKWPDVTDLTTVGAPGIQTYKNKLKGETRDRNRMVTTAALSSYLKHMAAMSVPEAGPRSDLVFPLDGSEGTLRVAVLVSGGIAPGINAVIDGIVQRHWNYQKEHGYKLEVRGYQNGFHGLLHNQGSVLLIPENGPAHNLLATSEFANQGGSILGTSRPASLISETTRLSDLRRVLARLDADEINILYVIGGDGSMRAAHALQSVAQSVAAEQPKTGKLALSVVAIPKTMDNDILWVWQSFGFMSAVEKSREFIHQLHTEVSSNPRLCVLQLFGSDSGFVVSHAVLASAAGHCDVALIPEVEFSLLGLANHLEEVIKKRGRHVPFGLVVMAETAIPIDAAYYVDPSLPLPDMLKAHAEEVERVRTSLKLDENERHAILEFAGRRAIDKRIEGQTDDLLRSAGLKMVMQGIEALLKTRPTYQGVRFDELRMMRNEPRHLVRAIPPSTSDIIMGQRLGTLAVDNAMAGYTDFMISQWLTEYVLVPLKLVVLGRKRIPELGIFWQSVLAKTGQPADLIDPRPRGRRSLMPRGER